MAIQKEFILRYRASGHVRFQIPAQVCEDTVRIRLEDGIGAIPGILNVRFFVAQCKLSIRFNETTCPFDTLAKQLFQLLAELEQGKLLGKKLPAPTEAMFGWRQKMSAKLKNTRTSQWMQGKYTDAKETVQAAKIITKIGMKKPKAFIRDPEKAIINFLNDILVLYLIKIHWKRVTQIWIPSPFKYRYEWMAVFYLFFLLMRSRRPKA